MASIVFKRLLAGWALLAAVGLAVAATPVRIDGTLWSEFGAPGLPGPGAPQTLVVDMTVDPIVPGSFAAWASGFTLSDVPAVLEVYGVPVHDTAFQASWFGGATPGVDFRFAEVFEPGDQLQVVLFFGLEPYEGSPYEPTLRAMNRAGSGFVYWFRAEEEGVEMSLGGRYQAGLVPEPASALLLLGGVLALAARVRRHRPAPAATH